MNIYHQCGHRFGWNIESLLKDGVGDGLIIGPSNIAQDKIARLIPTSVLANSWMDPQFYMPSVGKGQLATYGFFPAKAPGGFDTNDYGSYARDMARQCVEFQAGLGLRHIVVPVRYSEAPRGEALDEASALFVEPFIDAYKDLGIASPLLLTVIAKPQHLAPGPEQEELLTWATSFSEIMGVYLIFEHHFASKQIKDAAYLLECLSVISELRANRMEVHVGYVGAEALLFALARPTSVAMGSYENLRSFDIGRMRESSAEEVRRAPRARIYSRRLLQSVEDTYLPALRDLVGNLDLLFGGSPYTEVLLKTKLNFQRSEIYKHYFYVLGQQLRNLGATTDPAGHLRGVIGEAMEEFNHIRDAGVVLDAQSDGSHLAPWLSVVDEYAGHAG